MTRSVVAADGWGRTRTAHRGRWLGVVATGWAIVGLTWVLRVTPAAAFPMKEAFFDPTDGQFDVSEWLLTYEGVLPVPMIITEPAVGYGGGVGLLFFHESAAAKAARTKVKAAESPSNEPPSLSPPSMSGAVGFATENGTWGAGVFHVGIWRDDSLRYQGGLFRSSANLTFYGSGSTPLAGKSVDYNLQGWYLHQELVAELGDTRAYLGGLLSYFSATNTFDTDDHLPTVDDWELDFNNLGFGPVFKYDSRDNVFTPNRGHQVKLQTVYYSGSGNFVTSDREYQITTAKWRSYWPVHERLVLGYRLDGDLGVGKVPFYGLPYINLRGIPAQRYQGKKVFTTELEARIRVHERWSVIAFGGFGRAAEAADDLVDARNRWAGGTGFRYLAARALGLHGGLDVAWGPEQWAIYLQSGGAWNW